MIRKMHFMLSYKSCFPSKNEYQVGTLRMDKSSIVSSHKGQCNWCTPCTVVTLLNVEGIPAIMHYRNLTTEISVALYNYLRAMGDANIATGILCQDIFNVRVTTEDADVWWWSHYYSCRKDMSPILANIIFQSHTWSK